VKFLVDAQLPRRIAHWLRESGHDALHTLDLPEGNRTSDTTIAEIATREGRVVVTKDADFVNSFYLRGIPPKLLLISTGNIGNAELGTLLEANLNTLEASLSQHAFVEIDTKRVTIHA
jgi:predicted nuclease of predicted toxin-antitoxin system